MKTVDIRPHPKSDGEEHDLATLIHHRTGERVVVCYAWTETPSSDGTPMFPEAEVRRDDPRKPRAAAPETAEPTADTTTQTDLAGGAGSGEGAADSGGGDAPPSGDAESPDGAASS